MEGSAVSTAVATESTVSEISKISVISEKNMEVESVQFVIKTEAIEIPEPEAAEEAEEEKLSFWHKLLRLFGLVSTRPNALQ